MKPLISVIMPCFNRQNYIVQAIESILNQTYVEFEFIIIDDCSKDNTFEIVQKYAEVDKRIKALRNDKNMGIVYTLNRGLKEAKGKYITRMDDDDISLPQRFEKQVEFMEKNEDIVVCGSYVEVFDDNDKIYFPLMRESEPEILALMMNFGNPMGHSNIILRKDFLDAHRLSYEQDYKDAEDYYLWTQILVKGGKIANVPEILVKYRSHGGKISFIYHKHQQELCLKIIDQGLGRFFSEQELHEMKLPFDCRVTNIKKLYEILNTMQERDVTGIYSAQTYETIIAKYCGTKEKMHVAFEADKKDLQPLCVSMASILINSTSLDDFCFYILNTDLNEYDKRILEGLKKIKEFELVLIQVENLNFLNFFKLDLKRFIYIETGSVIKDSLNIFYKSDFKDKTLIACKEIDNETYLNLKQKLGLKESFNASVMLIHQQRVKQEKILEKLVFNTEILKLKGIYNTQNLLNLTCKNKWLEASLRLNVNEAIFKGNNQAENLQQLHFAKDHPIVITYTHSKPYDRNCKHKLWQEYWDYVKLTPFKKDYYTTYQEELKCVTLNLYGAKERITQQLSYKLGSELLSVKKQTLRVFILPYSLIKIGLQHKKEQKINQILIKIEPKFKPLPLDQYLDYDEALKVKNHLAFKLGQSLIKHPLTFVFRVKGICKEWKKQNRRK